MRRFQDYIAPLNFFDPACGSGNFLSETYICLRRLENKILTELTQGQTTVVFEQDERKLNKVSLRQFAGIEINDFAVEVANTALWIAQLQSNAETELLTLADVEDLPLREQANIVHANALTTDWAKVVPPEECSYIIGNPPFRGSKYQSAEQKGEIKAIFDGAKNSGTIDYVAGWHMKAARYMADHKIRTAFVSTNSICQGEQTAKVWSPIYDLGFRIDFAHDTFKWATETVNGANVHCVIVGFSKLGGPKRLFHHPTVDSDAELLHPTQLNAYLKDAPDVFVWNRNTPLCHVPLMGIGSQPIDNGNYLFTAEQKKEFLAKEPGAERFFHRWYGSQEFIKGIERWVLWVGEASPAELTAMPLVMERIQAVREFRLASRRRQTIQAAELPQHFGTEIIQKGESLLIPKVSSERRRYIPIGYLDRGAFASDLVFLVPEASLYHFGILQSRTHNAWMRNVAGRLKSDYRYSAGVVYNNFIWPEPTDDQKVEIEKTAQAVLNARQLHPDSTLADMYDPDNSYMFPELFAAHAALDAAVERAYGLEPGLDEVDLAAHLFRLYAGKINAIERRTAS